MSTDQGERARTSMAERCRLYRERKKAGVRLVQVQVLPRDVDALIEDGFLAAAERDDVAAIGNAIDNLLEHCFGEEQEATGAATETQG